MKSNSDLKSLIDTLKFLSDIGEVDVLEAEPVKRNKAVLVEAANSINTSESNDIKLLEKVSKTEARRKAEELAYNARTLEELYKALLSFEGCSLKSTAIHTVFSDGVSSSKIMFVGEAPGAEEDKLGKPFVGQSGQLLDKFLEWAGFSRSKNIYISNTIPWRPPGNRQPTSEETYICRPFLERHIELIRPKFLVMLGGTALKTFHNPKEGIVTLRGNWMPYTTENEGVSVETMPIFHPAFLLRSPGQKKLFWRDLLQIRLKAEAELGDV
ncbi:MAG: uracil-DNA glycosylase [Candidatus Paracaedibacteraceae bacterium]|nr:uracil-DNA glycosylase [Candidatus Paracaedibacteraceae bacterium]